MRPRFLLPLLVPLIIIGTGCAEHRLTVAKPDLTGAPHLYASNAIGAGAKQHREASECTTNIIHEVRVKQNLAQALATVLTLGLWMPTQIEYSCGNIASTTGSTDR